MFLANEATSISGEYQIYALSDSLIMRHQLLSAE